DEYRTDVVEKADMHNERFEKYYKAQNILPDDEWDKFLEAMRSPLPTTFRVAGSRQAARLLNDVIRSTHVPHLAGVVFEGESVSPPAQIPWYPEGLAWQFNVSKKVLRKSPEFKKFHSFLVYETEIGNISRQEAVSMLPPLFLEVEPHHRVIDMCAAPGSKTAQLLEALHANDTVTSSSIPSGLLIANDSDNKRTHLLIHQSARLPSPALMVTNLDASIYPAIKIPTEQTVFPSSTKARVAAKKQHQLLFDRILCDVPCSGDGTMRKNVGIWKHWQPMDGNGLHSLQLRILQRAMRMLKKGGRIVYSTCSLNPVENEAVVAAALLSMPEYELVDVSTHLPALVYRPGLTTWKPTVDRSINTEFATHEEYLQSLPEEKRADSKLLPSHWPPSADDAAKLNLPRCLRIYPHLQDTGGFFIAVLEKKAPPTAPVSEKSKGSKRPKLATESAPTPSGDAVEQDEQEEDAEGELVVEAVDEQPAEQSADTGTVSEGPSEPASVTPTEFRKQNAGKTKSGDGSNTHFKENPYTFIPPEDPLIQACVSRLNLKSDFPASNMMVRNSISDPIRSLYMTNDIVKSIVLHNDYTRIRLMTCGTKVFAKQEGAEAKREGADTHFRVLSEGLPAVLPYIEPVSIVPADLPALKILLETYYPLCSGFAEPFRSTIDSKANGSYIVRFEPGTLGSATLSHKLVLPLWKSNVSLTLMLDKKAKSALSLRLFGEDITPAGRAAAQKKQQASEPVTPAPETETPASIEENMDEA
ncbi:hypothetical protein CERSUDRAFT_50963, partial [Gelatoporia subvermispora B]